MADSLNTTNLSRRMMLAGVASLAPAVLVASIAEAKITPAATRGEAKSKRTTPMPEPLPKAEASRALWVGHEATRWFPFDPKLFLERAAVLGAPVQLSPRNDGVYYMLPDDQGAEYLFLMGWHNGCSDAPKLVAKVLKENDRIRRAHWRLIQKRRPIQKVDNHA